MGIVLMIAGGAAFATAAAALWLQTSSRIDRRLFAGLVATAVTLSLFSLLAWAATLIDGVAPLALTLTFVGILALLFARRLYRELRLPPGPR